MGREEDDERRLGPQDRRAKGAETTSQAVDRTNRSLLRTVRIFGILALAMLAGFLVWFGLYLQSNHGVSCQTNGLVRELIALVNRLLKAVPTHAHFKAPARIPTPPGCR